jgi:hypothetical protein
VSIFCALFDTKNTRVFTKTGSGQTQEKLKRRTTPRLFMQAGSSAARRFGAWRTMAIWGRCLGRNRRFCANFIVKMIILPRQARDKHRENSEKR